MFWAFKPPNERLVVMDDGRVFICSQCHMPAHAWLEIYDPVTQTFSRGGHPVIQRQFCSSTKLNDGTILVIGGFDVTFTFQATAEIYDPATDTFRLAGGTLNEGRSNHVVVKLSDGRVLVCGGHNEDYYALDSIEIYDPATEAFTLVGRMQTRRACHAAVLLNDGTVLICGGYNNNGDTLKSAEIYAP